ncbi:MAG: 2Fe-2S iron-sulfur cluster-binding protein, partial [Actinomycetota bacterium]|nr:2Fe-2S iron-sulfur cluster-binding protein [Actinomycetota bacterium]
MTPDPRPVLQLTVDGQQVEVADRGVSLLEVLREDLRLTSVKDGCSPQGQCGCCTVLVDGQPRVACVTPARRVAGRSISTVDGLEPAVREDWAKAFFDTGASQCGFCTPGIICRLEGLRTKSQGAANHAAVEQALLAHLCRCTGWRTILDAWDVMTGHPTDAEPATTRDAQRHTVSQVAVRGRDHGDRSGADQRATIESGGPQVAAPRIAVGGGQFADDTAAPDAVVAVPDGAGGWALGATLAEARFAAGKVQGRRTTVDATPPLELPGGSW